MARSGPIWTYRYIYIYFFHSVEYYQDKNDSKFKPCISLITINTKGTSSPKF